MPQYDVTFETTAVNPKASAQSVHKGNGFLKHHNLQDAIMNKLQFSF